jgi:hypothetical protein
MNISITKNRLRLSAFALIIAGVLFFLYPALRPFSDEVTLAGAEAFGAANWLAAHMLAMVAYTLLPLGFLGLYMILQDTPSERSGFSALIFSMLGIGLTLPFYGGEAYGLHAIGKEALRQGSADILRLAGVVRSGPGLYMFLLGLLLLGIGAIIAASAIWKSGKIQKWSGVPLALGFALYIPQFFGTQPLRIAHGLLVAFGCIWLAVILFKQS